MPMNLVSIPDHIKGHVSYHSVWFSIELILELLAEARACWHIGDLVCEYN